MSRNINEQFMKAMDWLSTWLYNIVASLRLGYTSEQRGIDEYLDAGGHGGGEGCRASGSPSGNGPHGGVCGVGVGVCGGGCGGGGGGCGGGGGSGDGGGGGGGAP